MGQALYRKYRSKSLDEIIGQDHITRTLGQAIKSGRISHAYLFTGPRGVGKTSIARILAHAINQLPYSDDSPHIDIIEIDAASNRRIDEIRDLREKVYISPTNARYKVYIIDEVHMLTKEAFNALLKTLEEPPAHVVFILATTDAHKLPETIISRTQRFSFKPVERGKVVKHLRQIAEAEKIDITDEALELIAEHGEGSFRDSISLLDQASNHIGKVGLADVQNLLGLPPKQTLEELLAILGSSLGEPGQIFSKLESLYNQGYQASVIAAQLGKLLRSNLVTGSSELPYKQTIDLLARLIDVPSSHNPDRFLEVVLLEAATQSANKPALAKPPSSQAYSQKTTGESTEESSQFQKTPASAKNRPKKQGNASPPKANPAKNSETTLSSENWPELLAALKTKHNTLYSFVRMAQPEFLPDKLELKFAFAFHYKRINDLKNRQIIADVIENLTGQAPEIVCVHDKTMPTHQPIEEADPSEPAVEEPVVNKSLSTISNIFGGAELLES